MLSAEVFQQWTTVIWIIPNDKCIRWDRAHHQCHRHRPQDEVAADPGKIKIALNFMIFAVWFWFLYSFFFRFVTRSQRHRNRSPIMHHDSFRRDRHIDHFGDQSRNLDSSVSNQINQIVHFFTVSIVDKSKHSTFLMAGAKIKYQHSISAWVNGGKIKISPNYSKSIECQSYQWKKIDRNKNQFQLNSTLINRHDRNKAAASAFSDWATVHRKRTFVAYSQNTVTLKKPRLSLTTK